MRAILAVAVFALAAPLAAQTAAPVPAPAPTTATPKFTVDTPVETIAADPAGKAALDSVVPGMTSHPMYEQFKTMSLVQLAPMSQGRITDEVIAKAKIALAEVK